MIYSSLSWSVETFKKNWQTLLLATVVAGLLVMGPNFLAANVFSGVSALRALLRAASWVLTPLGQLGLTMVAWNLVKGKKIDLQKAFMPDLMLLGVFIVANWLLGLAVGIGIILFIFPGIIAATRLQFAGLEVLTNKAAIIDSLKNSWKKTSKHFWPLLGMIVLAVVINLVGAIPFGLGLLFTAPVTMLWQAKVYSQLRG